MARTHELSQWTWSSSVDMHMIISMFLIILLDENTHVKVEIRGGMGGIWRCTGVHAVAYSFDPKKSGTGDHPSSRVGGFCESDKILLIQSRCERGPRPFVP